MYLADLERDKLFKSVDSRLKQLEVWERKYLIVVVRSRILRLEVNEGAMRCTGFLYLNSC